MSRKSQAAWLAAYQKADSLYTQHECGCLVVVMTDLPDVVRADRELIAREALAGRAFKRCKPADLPPLNCPQHQRATATA